MRNMENKNQETKSYSTDLSPLLVFFMREDNFFILVNFFSLVQANTRNPYYLFHTYFLIL